MWRLIKILLYIAILAALALVAYAYIGPFIFPADFAPPLEEINQPVTLESN